ncbi:Rgs10 [Acrasis kona]|uniref:Rgs10 n=1 Tax=Acrasis kona TaxID=1008807 RepID=A0AAW2Z996_9EUKA
MLSRFFEALSNKPKHNSTVKKTSPSSSLLVKRMSCQISIEEETPMYSRFSEVVSPGMFENSEEPLLRLVLSNPELHQMMEDFAHGELSSENIKCWDAIQRYRNANCFERRAELAHYLYNTFLGEDSITQVNISKETQQKVWKDIEDELYSEWMFDKLEQELEECLENIFSRFKKTEEYNSFMRNHRKTEPSNKKRRMTELKLPINSRPLLGATDGTGIIGGGRISPRNSCRLSPRNSMRKDPSLEENKD